MRLSPVFDQTYKHYLLEIGEIDYLAKAELLGVERDAESLIIPLYNETYTLSRDGITAQDGRDVPVAVSVILSRYVLQCQQAISQRDDPYKTYRDFKNTSPLVSYFTTNTNKTLESTFSGKLDSFISTCCSLGAVEQFSELYDSSMLFYALPRIPVVVNFNDRDELFPASCSVLYRASAEQFLDMECLAMTGTLLAGKLIRY
jgi:hypothetical protein